MAEFAPIIMLQQIPSFAQTTLGNRLFAQAEKPGAIFVSGKEINLFFPHQVLAVNKEKIVGGANQLSFRVSDVIEKT